MFGRPLFSKSWDAVLQQSTFPLILTDLGLSVNSTGMIENGLFFFFVKFSVHVNKMIHFSRLTKQNCSLLVLNSLPIASLVVVGVLGNCFLRFLYDSFNNVRSL